MALDQNFPLPLINSITQFLPNDIELRHLPAIHRRLSRIDDRDLFLLLRHLGWHGLITNNYKMLDVPGELMAIIRTQAVVVAVEGLGDDPLRAAGALLLELPGLRQRLAANRSNVVRIRYAQRSAKNAREILAGVASRRKENFDDLWNRHLVTADEDETARRVAAEIAGSTS